MPNQPSLPVVLVSVGVILLGLSLAIPPADGFLLGRRQAMMGNVALAQASTTSSRSMATATASSERVVVTGMGVISGCGVTVDSFWDALLAGKSSIGKIQQRFDISNYACQIGSEVPDHLFDPAQHFVNPKNIKANDRFTHFAVAAARQALKDAGLGDTPDTLANPERVGVMIGSAFGGMESYETETLKLSKKPDKPKVRSCSCSGSGLCGATMFNAFPLRCGRNWYWTDS